MVDPDDAGYVHPDRSTEDPAYGPAQGSGRGDFTGGPDVEIAVRTTGLLTAGRKPRETERAPSGNC